MTLYRGEHYSHRQEAAHSMREDVHQHHEDFDLAASEFPSRGSQSEQIDIAASEQYARASESVERLARAVRSREAALQVHQMRGDLQLAEGFPNGLLIADPDLLNRIADLKPETEREVTRSVVEQIRATHGVLSPLERYGVAHALQDEVGPKHFPCRVYTPLDEMFPSMRGQSVDARFSPIQWEVTLNSPFPTHAQLLDELSSSGTAPRVASEFHGALSETSLWSPFLAMKRMMGQAVRLSSTGALFFANASAPIMPLDQIMNIDRSLARKVPGPDACLQRAFRKFNSLEGSQSVNLMSYDSFPAHFSKSEADDYRRNSEQARAAAELIVEAKLLGMTDQQIAAVIQVSRFDTESGTYPEFCEALMYFSEQLGLQTSEEYAHFILAKDAVSQINAHVDRTVARMIASDEIVKATGS